MEKRKLTKKQKRRRRCCRIMARYGIPEDLFIYAYVGLLPKAITCSFNGSLPDNCWRINNPAKMKQVLGHAYECGEKFNVIFADDDIKLEGLLGLRRYLLIKDLAGI